MAKIFTRHRYNNVIHYCIMLKRIIKLPKKHSFFLFGPRQTGKSTLINSQYTKNIMKFDLLLSDHFFKYSKYPAIFREEIIEQVKNNNLKTVFVDEIQRIPILLNEVHFLISKYNLQFILTGSSARKLRRGGANLLAGRALEYNLFPLTYSEVKPTLKLETILRYGTLPTLMNENDSFKKEFLFTYVNTYLKEEIQAESLVRNLGNFSRFLDLAAEQSSELLSFSTIARECQLPIKTVQNYYEILEDTLIGIKLFPWRKSLRKRLVSHPKFYLFDTGITNAILKRLTAKFDSYIMGKLFEHWIVLETYRYLKYTKSEAKLYFWRSNIGTEVDLLIEKHGKITHAFEIKSTKYPDSRHLSGLRSFKTDYPQTSLQLICTAEYPRELSGIKILPWKNYLANLPHIL